jgi:hypothetical protein
MEGPYRSAANAALKRARRGTDQAVMARPEAADGAG